MGRGSNNYRGGSRGSRREIWWQSTTFPLSRTFVLERTQSSTPLLDETEHLVDEGPGE